MPLLFNDEIRSISEMISDSESHSICWYKYRGFQKQIEEIKNKINGKEEQFLEEIYSVIEHDEGWKMDDFAMIKEVFASEVKCTLKLEFEKKTK